MLWKGPPGLKDLEKICQLFVTLHLVRNAEFPRVLKDNAETLAKAIAGAHFGVVRALRPSPAKPFQAWNMRHVERVFDGGILRTIPETVTSPERATACTSTDHARPRAVLLFCLFCNQAHTPSLPKTK